MWYIKGKTTNVSEKIEQNSVYTVIEVETKKEKQIKGSTITRHLKQDKNVKNYRYFNALNPLRLSNIPMVQTNNISVTIDNNLQIVDNAKIITHFYTRPTTTKGTYLIIELYGLFVFSIYLQEDYYFESHELLIILLDEQFIKTTIGYPQQFIFTFSNFVKTTENISFDLRLNYLDELDQKEHIVNFGSYTVNKEKLVVLYQDKKKERKLTTLTNISSKIMMNKI